LKPGLHGAAAKPPRLQVGIASDADALAQVQFLPEASARLAEITPLAGCFGVVQFW
jgi:hypothetical protein